MKNPGVWKVSLLRLAVFPLAVLCVLKFSGIARLAPDGGTILMVSLLSSTTPPAAAVTQLAQVYSGDGEYAGAVNVIATLLCLVTVPIISMFF